MKLTKEQAIEKHRKMWNWIADQYRQGIQESVRTLKHRYILDSEEEADTITNDCYCCEYSIRKSGSDRVHDGGMCMNCPVFWGTECEEGQDGFYCELSISAYKRVIEESWRSICVAPIDTEECARLAAKIANLPERKCV